MNSLLFIMIRIWHHRASKTWDVLSLEHAPLPLPPSFPPSNLHLHDLPCARQNPNRRNCCSTRFREERKILPAAAAAAAAAVNHFLIQGWNGMDNWMQSRIIVNANKYKFELFEKYGTSIVLIMIVILVDRIRNKSKSKFFSAIVYAQYWIT